ncbi:MAG: 2-hydroxychromene-2-carboxylate isomerase [Woeseia sp.]
MADPIDFYFDFSSSYSYVGQQRLRELAKQHGREIRWKPVALGAIFKALGSAPHSPESAKGAYVWHDVERSAADAGLAYHWPTPFPFNSLMAARIFYYIAEKDEARAVEWAKAVFDASFGQGRDCSDPSELAAIANDLDLDQDDLLSAADQERVKNKLKEVTAEAMQKGMFGAPSFVLDGDMYWGADRIDQMRRYLARQQTLV